MNKTCSYTSSLTHPTKIFEFTNLYQENEEGHNKFRQGFTLNFAFYKVSNSNVKSSIFLQIIYTYFLIDAFLQPWVIVGLIKSLKCSLHPMMGFTFKHWYGDISMDSIFANFSIACFIWSPKSFPERGNVILKLKCMYLAQKCSKFNISLSFIFCLPPRAIVAFNVLH